MKTKSRARNYLIYFHNSNHRIAIVNEKLDTIKEKEAKSAVFDAKIHKGKLYLATRLNDLKQIFVYRDSLMGLKGNSIVDLLNNKSTKIEGMGEIFEWYFPIKTKSGQILKGHEAEILSLPKWVFSDGEQYYLHYIKNIFSIETFGIYDTYDFVIAKFDVGNGKILGKIYEGKSHGNFPGQSEFVAGKIITNGSNKDLRAIDPETKEEKIIYKARKGYFLPRFVISEGNGSYTLLTSQTKFEAEPSYLVLLHLSPDLEVKGEIEIKYHASKLWPLEILPQEQALDL